MKLFRITPPDAHVAFHLPNGWLSKINSVCESLDLTRSQLFRRSIAEYLKAFNATTPDTKEHEK